MAVRSPQQDSSRPIVALLEARMSNELARLVDASLYGGIALYAVVLYAVLGYGVYALVAWYLDARGIT